MNSELKIVRINFLKLSNHNKLFKISLPIIISNSTIPIVGIVDAAVIGQLSYPILIASIGLGASAMTTIYWLFSFLRMGTTGLASQSLGRGSEIETSSILVRGMIIGLICGIILIIFQDLIFYLIFGFLKASKEIETFAINYLKIRFWSCPLNIMLFSMIGWLIAKEKTFIVLILQLIMNLTNIILDFLFVFYFNFGIEGVAFATLISEVITFFLCLYFCLSAFKLINKKNYRIIFRDWKKFLDVNSNILLRSLLLQCVIVYHIYWGSTLDNYHLTINQIFILFLNFSVFVLDGFAFSAEVLVGKAVGQRNKNEIKSSFYICLFWSGIFGVILTTLYFFFTPLIVQLMTSDIEITSLSQKYIFWIIAIPLSGFLSWTLDGVFFGATETTFMRNAMLKSVVFYFFLILLFHEFEFNGMWFSLIIFFIFRGIMLLRYFPKIIEKFS